MNKLVQEFKRVRDLPYRIPLEIKEDSFNCAGKHKILKQCFEDMGYECRYRVCSFRWSDCNLPEELLKVPHEDHTTHAYLEVKINDQWIVVDATWDKGLSDQFQINNWNGKNSTDIAVPPIEIFSPEKSAEIMATDVGEVLEKDFEINGNFYKAFNNWLADIRRKS